MSRYRKKSLPELVEESSRGQELKKDNMESITDVLFIIFWIIVIKYIYDLENNCKCSDDWKRDFIKYSLIVFVIFLTLKVIFKKKLYQINKSILFLIILLNFIFIFIVAIYINELKKNECKCSESDIRTIFEIVNYIRMFLIIIGFLGTVYLYFNYFRNLRR